MTSAAPAEADTPIGFFTELEPDGAGPAAPVLTVLLRNRRCPWRCSYCDLWKEMLDYTVPAGAIPTQIDAAIHGCAQDGVHSLKLYNGGSFFDRAAIPPADHVAIAVRARRFKRVIVENHPSLAGGAVTRFRDLLGGRQLEVAMGLEIADDTILRRLNRRVTMDDFRRASDFLLGNRVAIRAFVMVKPPFVKSEEHAVEAAVASARFAFECGARVVSLIPTRFGTEAVNELAARGEFAPPRLETVERAFDGALRLARGLVFADLWDLRDSDACGCCFFARRDRLREMNLSQSVLPRIPCDCQRGASARVLPL